MRNKIDLTLLIKGIVCYAFGSIGAIIILLISRDDRNLRLHSGQSMIFYLLIYLIQTLNSFLPIRIPFLSEILLLLRVVITIVGTYHVYQRRYYKYPIIGDIYLKYFM